MNELEYRERMISIRLAELALLDVISQNVSIIASSSGKQVPGPNWQRAQDLYKQAKAVVEKLPPGG